MDQTFHCDLCLQEIPFVDHCRDETIFESGWTICACCEPALRQRLAQSVARTMSQALENANERRIRSRSVLEYPALAQGLVSKQQYSAPSLEEQEKKCLDPNKSAWTFPHIKGSGYQPIKKYQGLIDTYTASYMRWKNKAHVLAWLDSFDHPHALRPVFLDTETTGTQRFSEIIEVCIVDEHGQTLFHSLVNPTTEIEPMASAVHGLIRRDVKDAPRYPDIHEALIAYMHDHVIVAYNASFDIRLLKQTVDCYELEFPDLHVGCLMYAYAKYREEYVEQSNGQIRCKTHRLEEAIRFECLDLPLLHRAERDAHCVHKLFQTIKAYTKQNP